MPVEQRSVDDKLIRPRHDVLITIAGNVPPQQIVTRLNRLAAEFGVDTDGT